MLLIGDAAHPVSLTSLRSFNFTDNTKMLSFGGQGSNQAFEDVGALRCLFESAEPGEDVTKSLNLFDRVRRKSATRTQIMSNVRVGQEQRLKEKLSQYADPPGSCECYSYS